MNKLQTNNNKILKLNNIIKTKLDDITNHSKSEWSVKQMESYIKMRGAKPVGPLIQHTTTYFNDAKEACLEIELIMQCSNYIHKVEEKYSTAPVIRIDNCMYCHYIGPENRIKIAYDKLNVEAFENDINLAGEAYTVFLGKRDDNIIADVFMERAD